MGGVTTIGVDLGGTTIGLGCYAADGTCTRALSVPTPQPQYPDPVLDAIAAAIAPLATEAPLAIGIGTPGPADPAGRIARIGINLPGWREVPVADGLEARTGLPTVVANDANCAALGEAWLGAGRDVSDFIMLTLGTGVGGGIILNGRLFVGHGGMAGELGHITLYPDGPRCNSGNKGSLEQYLSIQAVRRRTGKDPAELGELAAAGDAAALAFWQEYGRDLGIGLATLTVVLTPQAIVIGGGIAASAAYFLPAAWEELGDRVPLAAPLGLKLLQARLGNRAGMAGAAYLAWQRFGANPPPAVQ